MSQKRDPKTLLLLKAAKTLIEDGEDHLARPILQTMDDAKAKEWLGKLGAAPRSRLQPLLWAALIGGIVFFMALGFGLGRASLSVPETASDSLFSVEDHASATAQIEHIEASQAFVQETSDVRSSFFVQTQTAVVQTATQSAISTQNGRATWAAQQTATQAAKGG